MANVKYREEECSLLLKTKQLLKEDSRTLLDLANESGLPFYWLQRLNSQSTFKNPSVNRIQHLYEFLSKTNLSV